MTKEKDKKTDAFAGRRNVTVKDIAKAAGVAVSTVSYALGSAPTSRVSQEKREEIRQIARRLGYRPNQAAKSLILRKNRRIGVLFSSLSGRSYSLLIECIQRELAKHGYAGICASWGSTYELTPFRKIYEGLLNASVDGVILAHSDFRPLDPDIPTVIYGQLEGRNCYDTYVRMTEDILRPCAAYLRELGHSRVAVMLFDGKKSEGVLPLMRSYFPDFSEDCVFYGRDTIQDGMNVLRRIAAIPPDRRPTALITRGDESAWGVYSEAAGLGLKIPDDLSVIGTTGLPESEFFHPALTSLNWDRTETAHDLVDLMLTRIENPGLPLRFMTPAQSLSVRKSCRKNKE